MSPTSNVPSSVVSDLRSNRSYIETAFENCQDIVIENWTYGGGLKYDVLSVYCSSLVSADNNHYLKRTLEDLSGQGSGTDDVASPDSIQSYFDRGGAAWQGFTTSSELSGAVELVLQGYVVLLFEGWDKAVAYKVASFEKRQVTEPVSEPVVKGPREGTIENIDINLGMIRQRIQTPRLKIEFLSAGETSKTSIAFCYLDRVVLPSVLEEFKSRLKGIEKYDVPETSYVEDWIQDSAYSPFPQYRYTERTDAVAAALMDGKVAVLVENSPAVMIAPSYFVDFIGTGEDYYVRTVFASMVRVLRLLAFLIALTLPSIYIALSTFHSELIPTVLLLAILDTREGIPFPAFIEALIMEVSFELLREAGIRLPRPVGSAVSIVGALVIGQAAIMAKIASPIMVIVVALTGIASFAIPHYEIAIAIRILRFPLMLAATLLGASA
nr:spore germination protein [Cohnella faecalis]